MSFFLSQRTKYCYNIKIRVTYSVNINPEKKKVILFIDTQLNDTK
jgi:hypothetical protein